MTAVDNNITSSIQSNSNFVYPKNRKEIGELIAQFKNSSNGVPKTREEIKDYISLIKKQYREDKRKLRLENKSKSGYKASEQNVATINSIQPQVPSTTTASTTTTSTTSSNDTKNERKQFRELIREFKKSSDTPKSRNEISEFIHSIKNQETIQGSNTNNTVNSKSDCKDVEQQKIHRRRHHGRRNHSNCCKTNLIPEVATNVELIVQKVSNESQFFNQKIEKLKLKKEFLLKKVSLLDEKIEKLSKSESVTKTTL
ncbi:hypothetical protein ACTFIU_001951 [Dictyostelium citrinum]